MRDVVAGMMSRRRRAVGHPQMMTRPRQAHAPPITTAPRAVEDAELVELLADAIVEQAIQRALRSARPLALSANQSVDVGHHEPERN